MNVFVVNTPLQLINAVEAKGYFGIPDGDALLIVIHLGNRFKQLQEVVDERQWAEVVWLESEEEGLHGRDHCVAARVFKWVSGCRCFVRHVSDIKECYRAFQILFLGNYLMGAQLHIANTLQPERVVLLDDGNASLTTAEFRNAGITHFQSRVGAIDKIKYLLKRYILLFRLNDVATVTFFTTYDFDISVCDKIIRNKYSHIRRSMSCKPYKDEIWFIGAPLVEQGIVGFADFCSLLEKVIDCYGCRKIVYIKHPGEALRETEDYLEQRGVEVLTFLLPIELILLSGKELPIVVATFYSSALYNLRQIFAASIECNAFRIDDISIRASFLPRVSATYDYFESISNDKFKVISI